MTLDEILVKIRDDDTVAFGLLFHLLYPGMCQYASQLLGDRYVAEEVVQDVFLKIWNKRKDIFSVDGSIRKYFYRLVHNQCLDILRKHNTRKGYPLMGSGGGLTIFYGTKDTLLCGSYGLRSWLLSGRVPNVPGTIRRVTGAMTGGHEQDWVRACKENAGNRVKTKSDFSEAGTFNECNH